MVIGALKIAGIENASTIGAFLYLAASFVMRFFVAREHRQGIVLLKNENFSGAIPLFEKSYTFFSKHSWIDRWRFLIMLSSSRISYREIALLNIAFCQAQLGNKQDAMLTYDRVQIEFPGSKMAEVSIRMLQP